MATSINWPNIKNPSYPLEKEREDNVLRSNSEFGYVMTRQRYTKARRTYTLEWEAMRKSDYLIFAAFYDDTLKNGSLSFNWTNPETEETCECRFSGPFKDKLIHQGIYEISATIIEV